MDRVRGLTPLAVLVLAMLGEDEMHPYEMIRLMRARRDDRLVRVTPGSVYNTIARLVADGLAREVGVDRAGNRPERTIYALTAEGHTAVLEWVRRQLASADRPENLRVALAECHLLPREEVIALLEVRRETLTREHGSHVSGLASARGSDVAEQYLIEVDRECVLLAADLHWTDSVLSRLRDRTTPWGPSDEKSDRYLAQREAARQ